MSSFADVATIMVLMFSVSRCMAFRLFIYTSSFSLSHTERLIEQARLGSISADGPVMWKEQ